MKKILFVTNKLVTGGMEVALLQTVKFLKSYNFDITVAIANQGGDLLEDFKEICTIKDLSMQYSRAYVNKTSLINNIKKFQLFSAARNFCILFRDGFLSYFSKKKKIAQRMLDDPIEYDIAIAYATPYTSYVPYVVEKIKAKQKIAWVQLDVTSYLSNIDMSDFEKCYFKLDTIVCDSKPSKESFISRHPSLAEKTIVIHNPIDVEKIHEKSQKTIDVTRTEKEILICSVGRLNYIKGFDMAISAHKLLKDRGYYLKWMLCGSGDEINNLKIDIQNNGLVNEFILLGNQKNPYKYINAADIYVQPSRTESYCITLAEARVLKKPIVTTNFPCACEHVIDGHNGFICEMTPESIADAIEKLILSPELREKFSQNTTPVDSDYSKLKELFN